MVTYQYTYFLPISMIPLVVQRARGHDDTPISADEGGHENSMIAWSRHGLQSIKDFALNRECGGKVCSKLLYSMATWMTKRSCYCWQSTRSMVWENGCSRSILQRHCGGTGVAGMPWIRENASSLGERPVQRMNGHLSQCGKIRHLTFQVHT